MMSPIELAYRYMEIFFSGRDFHRLYDILADDLKFSGPFYQFTSAKDYIASLEANPPLKCTYEILHVFDKGDRVNLIYEFAKPETQAKISQLFEVEGDKISKMLLIFDTAQFV